MSNIIYVSVILSAVSYSGYILFIVAMHGLSNVYGEKRIFNNSLYGFCATIIGAVVFIVAAYHVLTPVLDQLTTYSTIPGTAPPLSIFVSLLQVMMFIWIGSSILAAINGFFYRRAFYALAEKSGEGSFRTVGLLMVLGGALTIIFVGGLLFFIGWIVATVGFSSMKPRPTQTFPIPPQEIPTRTMAQMKLCPNCGKENMVDAIFCSRCGKKL
jgi:uncharacterized membrane protein